MLDCQYLKLLLSVNFVDILELYHTPFYIFFFFDNM